MQSMWYYTYVKKTIFCITNQQLKRTLRVSFRKLPSDDRNSVKVHCLIAQAVSQSVKSIKASFPTAFVSGMHCQMCFVRNVGLLHDNRQINWLYSSQADYLKS